MQKKITIKAHYRKGKYIPTYKRSVEVGTPKDIKKTDLEASDDMGLPANTPLMFEDSFVGEAENEKMFDDYLKKEGMSRKDFLNLVGANKVFGKVYGSGRITMIPTSDGKKAREVTAWFEYIPTNFNGDITKDSQLSAKVGMTVMKDKLYIEAVYINKSLQGKGAATAFMSQIVNQAKAKGFNEIYCRAMRNDDKGETGYYVWPKLGFEYRDADRYNQKWKFAVGSALPKNLKKAKNIQHLLSMDGGEAWWKENGFTCQMTFSLKEGSTSLQLFNNYVERKSKNK